MHSAQLADEATSEASLVSDSDIHQLRSSSRSPHPYHRRGVGLPESEVQKSSKTSSGNGSTGTTSHSSSESGTEADDERGAGFLKVLPAPPLRARKGVRGATPADRTPAISPHPTPSILSGTNWAFPFPQSTSAPKNTLLRVQDIRRREAQDKYSRRKRAEIVRRIVEAFLLGVVGLVSATHCDVLSRIRDWKWEIYCHVVVASLLAFLYPLRYTLRAYRSSRDVLQSLHTGFRIPSRFDPGPLLYPVFLPLIVAISLLPRRPEFLLANSILGLSSLPKKLAPSSNANQILSTSHWFITLVPLVVAQTDVNQLQPHTPFALKTGRRSNVSAEDLTLLYPLQCLMTRTIYFLTTTSLDPAELQLLSAALINILLFSVSPQAEVMKSLLWLGGLGLFVSCRKVLGWEVALARVPSWRFRRRGPKKRSTKPLFGRLDVVICQKLANLTMRRKAQDASESDDDDEDSVSSDRTKRAPRLRVKIDGLANGHAQTTKAASAIEPPENGKVWDAKGRNGVLAAINNRRRHTFSITDLADQPQKRTTAGGRARRTLSPDSSSFAKLTLAQARVRKWMYAGFVYAVAVLIIMVPIRRYVSIYALSSHEPFGWAFGYLLGNIPQFRFWIVSNNFEQWISLPERLDDLSHFDLLGWIDRFRQETMGSANTRLLICAYCLAVLMSGIATVLRLTSVVEVDTRRKVFHGIMVAMLLPTVFADPCFIALALILILAGFLLLDLFRASQMPPISKPLTLFLAPYVDGRDHRGPVIVSHIFLLIGCAIPLWLSLAGAGRSGTGPWIGWDTHVRDVSMVSGVICVGMGDAAASLIGRRFGRHKWLWSGGKSLEGSLAFAVAVTIGLITSYAWLLVGGWVKHGPKSWMVVAAKAAAAATGASLTEAVLTSCNDNVVVPVALWLLVRGLGM